MGKWPCCQETSVRKPTSVSSTAVKSSWKAERGPHPYGRPEKSPSPFPKLPYDFLDRVDLRKRNGPLRAQTLAPVAADDAMERPINLGDIVLLVPCINALLTELEARLTTITLSLVDRGIPWNFFPRDLSHGYLIFPSSLRSVVESRSTLPK